MLGETLAKLNFEVTTVFDAGKRDLEKSLRNFGGKAAKADVILVYYAGHAVQVDGQNYMVPVDASLNRLDDLPYDAVPLGLFLGSIRNASSAGLMIVDACRNNPFVEKLSKDTSSSMKIGIGLGRVDDTPSGTLLAMATRANSVAYDGAGEHSPYTQAILEELATPGVELHLFFGRVADRVKKLTGNKQEPYISGALGGTSVYLNPKPANRPPVIARQALIEVTDSDIAKPLGLRAPTDPDPEDRLNIEITSLPVGGDIRIGSHVLAKGDSLSAPEIGLATFTANGTVIGNGGALSYRVTDGKGGTAEMSIPFKIVSANRPPLVSASGKYVAARNWLGISLPIDPDGDHLSVTVESVPQVGKIMDGAKALVRGDVLEPGDLSRLVFFAEDALSGPVGRFSYRVADGRGASVVTVIDISIAADGSSGFTPNPAEAAPVVAAVEQPAVEDTKQDKAAEVTEPEPEATEASFADCVGCPVMVPISGGAFAMGSEEGKRNELPVREVTVKPFAVSKYEVTVEEWRACVTAGACAAVDEMNAEDEFTPIRNISWDDSMAFVKWLSGKSGKNYRLLSEAEWEFAARAGAKSKYWWGDKMDNALVRASIAAGRRMGRRCPWYAASSRMLLASRERWVALPNG